MFDDLVAITDVPGTRTDLLEDVVGEDTSKAPVQNTTILNVTNCYIISLIPDKQRLITNTFMLQI